MKASDFVRNDEKGFFITGDKEEIFVEFNKIKSVSLPRFEKRNRFNKIQYKGRIEIVDVTGESYFVAYEIIWQNPRKKSGSYKSYLEARKNKRDAISSGFEDRIFCTLSDVYSTIEKWRQEYYV